MADQDYGVFTPADCQRIWRTVKEFERLNPLLRRLPDIVDPTPIYYRNDSGQTIPAYSIMQIDETVEDEQKNYFKVIKPISWTSAVVGPFLFSGTRDVEAGKFSIAQSGPVYQVKKDGTSLAINDRLGPKNGQWTISKGSMYTYVGTDALETDLIKVVDNHTPILGITNESIAAGGVGNVTKKDPSSGDWVAGSTVYEARNPSTTSIASGALVLLFPVDAKWAAVAIC